MRTWAWIVLIEGGHRDPGRPELAAGGGFGRWFGIIVAGIAIIIQFMFLPAQPFWSLLAIFIYVMVMYGLIVYPGRREA